MSKALWLHIYKYKILDKNILYIVKNMKQNSETLFSENFSLCLFVEIAKSIKKSTQKVTKICKEKTSNSFRAYMFRFSVELSFPNGKNQFSFLHNLIILYSSSICFLEISKKFTKLRNP